jgi:translation initiation factor IF-2
MYDDHNRTVEEAGPSTPVRVVGFDEIPMAGDELRAVEDMRLAYEVATERREKIRIAGLQERQKVTLENLFASLDAGKVHEIRVVLKADVQGSLEVLRRELTDLKHEEVKVKILRDALGGITEDDVLLAEASGAVVIGFNVVADDKARLLAEARSVEVRSYQIIYELIDEVKAAMEGVLRPVRKEKVNGRVEVRQVFKVSKLGNIAGCYVTTGFIQRNNKVRLIRDGKIIYTGDLDSLKRFKDDVREVKEGFECGIRIAGYDDVKVGDFIEPFEVVEEKRVLAI